MKYFQTKEQAFETMNRLELRITELAKKTTDLTILSEDRIEYNQLKELIYQYSEGRNKVTENALGQPCIWEVVPNDYKVSVDYLSASGANFDVDSPKRYEIHPAMIVSGKPVKALLRAKYVAGYWNGNRAVSLPGLDPSHDISYDGSLSLCKAANGGKNNIGMVTAAMLGLEGLQQLCDGFFPRGNDNYGKSYKKSSERGEPSDTYTESNGIYRIGRCKTGSGPLSWRIGGSPFGAEVRPGVSVWAGGFRTLGGELNFIQNNNALLYSSDHSASSSDWKSLLSDGTFADVGAEGSYKYDYTTTPNGGATNGMQVVTSFVHRQTEGNSYMQSGFSSISFGEGVAENMYLKMLLKAKLKKSVPGFCWSRNLEGLERFPCCRGGWGNASDAGPAYAGGSWDGRSSSNGGIGFALGSYE